jgi:hypothetical protein
LQELFIYAKRTFPYDPDVWGDTVQEAVARVRDGYVVPWPMVKLLVQHAAAMQTAMICMDSAVEERMTDLDELAKELPASKNRAKAKTRLLMNTKPQEEAG